MAWNGGQKEQYCPWCGAPVSDAIVINGTQIRNRTRKCLDCDLKGCLICMRQKGGGWVHNDQVNGDRCYLERPHLSAQIIFLSAVPGLFRKTNLQSPGGMRIFCSVMGFGLTSLFGGWIEIRNEPSSDQPYCIGIYRSPVHSKAAKRCSLGEVVVDSDVTAEQLAEEVIEVISQRNEVLRFA